MINPKCSTDISTMLWQVCHPHTVVLKFEREEMFCMLKLTSVASTFDKNNAIRLEVTSEREPLNIVILK